MGKLLKPQEVADKLGISRETVYAWARNGNLKAHKLGPRVLRFDAEEITAAVHDGQNGDAPKPVDTEVNALTMEMESNAQQLMDDLKELIETLRTAKLERRSA